MLWVTPDDVVVVKGIFHDKEGSASRSPCREFTDEWIGQMEIRNPSQNQATCLRVYHPRIKGSGVNIVTDNTIGST
jgi:hypothetical protein